MNEIHVAICDDMAEICNYYQSVISCSDSLIFDGSSTSCQGCLELVSDKKPDILLLDMQIEEYNSGIKLIDKIRHISPKTKIIILTINNNKSLIFDALSQGAVNYVLKDSPDSEIINTIETVACGKKLLSHDIAIKLIDECKEIKDRQQSLLYIFTNLIHLSNLEFEILRYYCMGYSYKQLSEKYFVEDTTVRSHMSRIMKKLGFSSASAMKDTLNNLKVFELFNQN